MSHIPIRIIWWTATDDQWSADHSFRNIAVIKRDHAFTPPRSDICVVWFGPTFSLGANRGKREDEGLVEKGKE
jgi:hypothetical protein